MFVTTFYSCTSPKLEKNIHWERQLASVQPHTKNSIAYQRNNKMTHHRQQAMGESEQRNFDVMLQFAERSITYDRKTDQPMVACFATLSLGPHFTKHSSVCLVNPAALLWLLYYSQGRLLFNLLDVPLYVFFSVALRPNACYGLLILEVSRSHTTTHHSR